jgi:hypothetical protein
MYVLLFGLSTLDLFIDRSFPDLFPLRLRRTFLDFGQLSLVPFASLLAGYLLFLVGYKSPVGRALARLVPFQPGSTAPKRCLVVCSVMFAATFAVLVLYSLNEGYGRFKGTSVADSGMARMSLLGELSLIPYAFVAWQHLTAGSGSGRGTRRGVASVLFWLMGALQVAVSILIGVRSRVFTVFLIAVAARHYGVRQVRPRRVVEFATFVLIVMLPVLDLVRGSSEVPFGPAMVWDSVMRRSSALEGFTVTFDRLEDAPAPDPLWLVVVGGLVPHFLWQGKPLSKSGEDFSLWASGNAKAQFAPSLPGELLMLFGRVGGTLAMFALGAFWRFLFELFVGTRQRRRTWGVVYIGLLPTFLATEASFVMPYSVLVRFLAVGVLLSLLVRARQPANLVGAGTPAQ